MKPIAKIEKQDGGYIAARAEGEGPVEILIMGAIGDWWDENDALSFAEKLQELPEKTDLKIRVNSFGGSVAEGTAISNAIRRHNGKTEARIEGVAMSIASLIALSADRVVMADNAMLMIHAPWSVEMGNAEDLRRAADTLDKYSEALSAGYASMTGKDKEYFAALLRDGEDHYWTAEEALADGLIDEIYTGDGNDAMACLDGTCFGTKLAKRQKPCHNTTEAAKAAALPPKREETEMGDTPKEPAAKVPDIEAEKKSAVEAAMKGERDRVAGIKAAFSPFKNHAGVATIMDELIDSGADVAAAREKLLVELGKDSEPVAGATAGTDQRDKKLEAMEAAILARAGKLTPEERGKMHGNPYRDYSLYDIGKECAVAAGYSPTGRDRMEVAGAAFTQTSSDFPVLQENIMHKMVMRGYTLQPWAWRQVAKVGSVTDFRPHTRYKLGSIGNMQALNENGEYEIGTIPDGEKATISVDTKGLILNWTRKAMINDDLGVLQMGIDAGLIAGRTIETDFWTYFQSNPTLDDGTALIRSANTAATAGAPTIEIIDAMRQQMAVHTDISGNDYLDIRPSIAVAPLSLGSKLREINGMEYNDEATKRQNRPNVVRGLFGQVVESPRLAATKWYMLANPNEGYGVFEVAFLNGQDTPFLDMEDGFSVDGTRWKVRLDYGIKALDFRGFGYNAGA